MLGQKAKEEPGKTDLSPIFLIKSKLAKSLIWVCKSYFSCYEA